MISMIILKISKMIKTLPNREIINSNWVFKKTNMSDIGKL